MTATIRVRMPNERQARQVVEATLKLRTEPNRTWGKRGEPFADFALLRYPVYLPMMRELAERGDARGLEALGAMAFPEATEALLELTNHQDPAIGSKAEELLLAQCLSPVPQPAFAQRTWPSARGGMTSRPAACSSAGVCWPRKIVKAGCADRVSSNCSAARTICPS